MPGVGTLQIRDEDLVTVRFDLNLDTGVGNAGGLKTFAREFRPRIPPLEAVRFEPRAFPGGLTTFVRDPLTIMSWRQGILGTTNNTFEELSTGAGELTRLLRAGGVMYWLPPGSTEARYYDFEPSDGAPLLGDEPEDLFRALTSFAYPAGIPLSVVRQPYRRLAELAAILNIAANPTLLIDRDGAGRPDSWAWVSAADISGETIDPATEAYSFNIATTADRDLNQTSAVGTAAPGEVWTFSFKGKVSSGTWARVRAVLVFVDAAGAVIGAEQVGTLTDLTTNEQRISITSTAAPALTSRIAMAIRFQNSAATSIQVKLRHSQLEKSASVSRFRCSAQAFSNDPTVAGQGRMLPVWIEGDAPCPVKFKLVMGAGSDTSEVLYASRLSHGVLGKLRLADFLNRHHFRAAAATTLGETGVADTDATAVGGTALALRHRRQHKMNNGNSTGPTVTWDQATKAGSTLLAFLYVDYAGASTTITDPAGWTLIRDDSGGTVQALRTYKIENASARSGAETATLGVAKAWGVAIVEVQAGGVVDVVGGNRSDAGGTGISSGTASPSNANDHVAAFCAARVAGGAQSSPTNAFTQIETTTPNVSLGLYERVVTAVGSYSTVATIASAPNMGAIVAVKAEAGLTIPTQQRHFRQEISTALESLRGSVAVYLRLKPFAADQWRFQLKWAPSLGTAERALPSVTKDFRDVPTFGKWVEVRLGTITVPNVGALGGVTLEVWAERTATAVASSDVTTPTPLRFDSLFLVPLDDTLTHLLAGSQDTETFLGKDLVTPVASPAGGTAGVASGTEMKLDTLTDNAGSSPNGGTAWSGSQKFTFAIKFQSLGEDQPVTCKIRIRNVTDGTNVVEQNVSIVVVENGVTTKTVSIFATLTAGKLYQAQVDDPSAAGVNDGFFYVQTISRTGVPTLASGENVLTDAAEGTAHVVDASDNLLRALTLEGPVPDLLEPGLNLIHAVILDAPAGGFDDFESVLSRTGTLSVTHAPRFYE